MDYRLELIIIPVSDVDRAKSFYVDGCGFNADHDHTVSDAIRFVQNAWAVQQIVIPG
jgi:catechol 2,3-dioxygenase-like lactoylglutathione lyase family enzyme